MPFIKGNKPWNTGKKLSVEHRRKISNWSKLPRKKHITIHCKTCHKPMIVTINKSKAKKFCSGSCHGRWRIGERNPNYGKGQNIRGKKNPMYNPVWREKAIKNLMKAVRMKPNKMEDVLLKLIIILDLPFKYNNGKIIIGNKIPDFYHQTKKKLIEFNGRYWHRNDDGQKLLIYRDLGFDCLVIWEEELLQLGRLKRRLINFEKK